MTRAKPSVERIGVSPVTLLDIPDDVITALLSLFEVPDLCLLRRVCGRLDYLAQQDQLWEEHCRRWIEQQQGYGFTDGLTTKVLFKAFNAPSFLWLYQALRGLGGWPVGVWRRTDSDAQPFGEMLCIGWSGNMFVGHKMAANGEPKEPVICVEVLNNDNKVAIRTLCAGQCPQAQLKFHILSGKLEIECVQPANERAATWFPPFRFGRFPGLQTEPSVRYYDKLLDMTPTGRYNLTLPQHVTQDLPSAVVHALDGLQGLWSAPYGPHGHEVVSLRFMSAVERAPPGCSIQGTRMEAMKVTGDVNVPATSTSFVLDLSSCVVGRYVGEEPAEEGFVMNRPIVFFSDQGMTFVDLSEREVVARFGAQGCINRDSRMWKPEWVSASVLLYEGGERVFSVLFADDDEHFRHMMDFKPVSLNYSFHGAPTTQA